MNDKDQGAEPEANPADERVKRVRDRTMNLLAEAAVNVQRLERVAEKLGLTADLVDDVGDYLYEAVVSQLDLASKIVERSQSVADRILAPPPTKRALGALARLDVRKGEIARVEILVSNTTGHSADVGVHVAFVSMSSIASAATMGRRRLEPGQETYVEVSIDTQALAAGDVYPGTVRTSLEHGAQTTDLGHRDFEIWVRA